MDAALASLSEAVGTALRDRGLTLATAESCTGGWVAQVVTHTAGSSGWFDRGFVTYANEAKVDMLGVRPETLARYGAVSPETAAEMATGALDRSKALISLSITGIAGPTGGSPDKPVGTVCFGWCLRGDKPEVDRRLFAGTREEIRRQAVMYALAGLLARTGGAKTVP
jgi:nicotinamide-nucleotide amidase